MSEGMLGVRSRRRRRRIRTVVVSGAVVVTVGAVATAALGFGGSEPDETAHSTMPPATAKVTRMTLTETEDVDGTLGHGSTTTVESQASGKITWLPALGSTLQRGKPLYKVDDKPVVLLYGSLPMYRQLSSGVEGRDVKQFEQNLSALGYTDFTVDETYSAATATAVKAWQEDLGLTETGSVNPDAVVYASGAIRVAEHKGHLGGPASGVVLSCTGTTRQVSIDLDVAKQRLVKTGASVTVKLPDATTVAGTVASVGKVAETQTGSDGKSETTTIEVVVAIKDQSKLGSFDEAPVDVTFVSSQRKDVLTVPITALLALVEGGYGVQVVEGDTTRIVAVKTGMFAGGRVEISGDGITTDTVVGVPK
jgi:peptidoglycan hydrolase-like protein with peptidoglycan-binding domain